MLKVQKKLTILLSLMVIFCIVIVLLFELEILPIGIYTDKISAEFVLITTMEIITICVIPIALKMAKSKYYIKQLTCEEKAINALKKMSIIRLCLIGVPLITNTLLYYLFMKVTFAYLALILIFTLIFIIPSKTRCKNEIQRDKNY